jgi:hypothetical protein
MARRKSSSMDYNLISVDDELVDELAAGIGWE